jgi:hypothetical protein
MPKVIIRQTIPTGATVENSDATYTDTVASGGTLVLPDTDIEVNGVNEGSVPSVNTIDFQLTDGVNPVTPDSVTVVGNVVTAQVPACPPAVTRSTATLMKTGQTTQYRAGDDGAIQAGRATNFTTLDTAPVHNDGSATLNTTTNRFTDILGGQTYADNIVLDWSTWNGSTLVGWRRTASTGVSWNNAIDGALSVSIGIFTSGWHLPNRIELASIMSFETGLTHSLNYAPFNLTANLWTSTTRPNLTTFAVTLTNNQFIMGVVDKTTGVPYIPVRTFSLSTSNILS